MPDKTVVVNSTPIIALYNIQKLDILHQLYGEIVIPEAVKNEVSVKNHNSIEPYNWIKVIPIKNKAAKETFTSALHAGEVEVMILAKEIKADLVIMDDRLARKYAKYLGINLSGTIGVLLKAKKEKVIDKITPALDDLVKDGFYLSDQLYSEILKLAGE